MNLDLGEETLRLDLTTPDEFCSICKKVPIIRLMLDLLVDGDPYKVSVCRDCLAEYAPAALAVIEGAVPGVS